jgi:simple sugar transport system permease protein
MDSNAKEPLIHLTKRGAVPVRRAIAIRIFAVVIALIVCAIITGLTTGINPIEVYSSIVSGASAQSERLGSRYRMFPYFSSYPCPLR